MLPRGTTTHDGESAPVVDGEEASMFLKGCIAPSYEELRPMKPLTSDRFPVYRDLTDLLVAPPSHPDGTVAHVLATCSGYAYGDEETVAMIMARITFWTNPCACCSRTTTRSCASSRWCTCPPRTPAWMEIVH